MGRYTVLLVSISIRENSQKQVTASQQLCNAHYIAGTLVTLDIDLARVD
jgi:hypothetical protein